MSKQCKKQKISQNYPKKNVRLPHLVQKAEIFWSVFANARLGRSTKQRRNKKNGDVYGFNGAKET